MPFAPNVMYPDGQPLTGFSQAAATATSDEPPPPPQLDRAIADVRTPRKPIPVAGFSAGATQASNGIQVAGYTPPAAELPDNSIVGRAINAVVGLPANVSRTVTGLLNPNPKPAPTPALADAAVPVAQPPAPAVQPQPFVAQQSGTIPSSFTAKATAVVDPNAAPTAPPVTPVAPSPRLNFNVGYGQNVGGGVFGALARNVNDVAAAADSNNARKVTRQGFTDSITSFDANTKRQAVVNAGEVAKAKNTVDLLKAGKEVQEAQLLQTHRQLLAEYMKNPTPELADMIALVKGHVLPDKVIQFPESIIQGTGPSAVSVRHGTALTADKGGGFSVRAVGANAPSPNDKAYINAQGQRVRIVNGKEVAF